MRGFKHMLTVAAAVILTSVSCIYDFNPLQSLDSSFWVDVYVFEGDILAGDITEISIRSASPIYDNMSGHSGLMLGGTSYDYAPYTVYFDVSVECSDGTVIPAVFNGSRYRIDTRNIDLDKEYRLVAKRSGSEYGVALEPREYVSAWLPVMKASAIDSVSFEILDEERLAVEVSAGGAEPLGGKYFRWTGKETWEYTAPLYASAYYDWNTNTIKYYKWDENNNFYCWKSAVAPFVKVGKVEDYDGGRIIGRKLFEYDNMNSKLQYVYSVEILQETISEEAYRFWTALEKNTFDVGGLFSPQPSEIRGNIVNPADSSELVIGYISASQVSRAKVYIDQRLTRFYKGKTLLPDPEVLWPDNWLYWYWNGYCPFAIHEEPNASFVDDRIWDWYPRRCLDCTLQGGTTQKPEGWDYSYQESLL
ncbi:MAG: DUF4249 family protein [Bacteroidales bacterium]|nr:DUF4249 family protein [Bacteroidales bacterium]